MTDGVLPSATIPPVHPLASLVPALSGARVLVVGDVMLDEYLYGDTERISPEAPVPVVQVVEERTVVGGAGNVARNIKALGGEPLLLGVCGIDSRATMLEGILQHNGIAHSLIRSPDRPTTVKTRILARHQQMLRIDREKTTPLSSVVGAELLDAVKRARNDYDVIVISDYCKGLLSARFMKELSALCDSAASPKKILVDPKPVNFPLYSGVFLLTPNAKETSEGAGMPMNSPEEIIAAGRALLQRLGCEHLLTTLGGQGMALFMHDDEVWHLPTTALNVFDVTGAGDTVIATLALALAAGLPLLDGCSLANYAAGIVVGQLGSAVATPQALSEAIHSLPQPQLNRWA